MENRIKKTRCYQSRISFFFGPEFRFQHLDNKAKGEDHQDDGVHVEVNFIQDIEFLGREC